MGWHWEDDEVICPYIQEEVSEEVPGVAMGEQRVWICSWTLQPGQIHRWLLRPLSEFIKIDTFQFVGRRDPEEMIALASHIFAQPLLQEGSRRILEVMDSILRKGRN